MKNILLIEDNEDVRENTSEILEHANFKVTVAENGKRGVELAKKINPDLIICDIMMPELDGYGVLNILSRNSETATIPFIFLTAKSEHSDVRKGMSQGADDYITKPFDENELLLAIDARLKKSSFIKNEYQKSADGVESFILNAQSIDDLNTISQNRTLSVYRKKQMIYTEGSHPRGIYFIQNGKVKTFRSNEDGKEYIISLLNQGDFFGYISLLEDKPHSDSAEALEDSEIYFIPQEDFFSLLRNNREVSNRFIKMLSNNLSEMEDRILKLAYNSVRKRVAEALVFIEKTYHKTDQPFSMVISREDVANIVGTSTETVIRALSDFKDENLIEIKGRSIQILNLEKLKNMKN